MGFRFRHGESTQHGVRRVALERLDRAIAGLDALSAGTPDDVESIVHEIRRDCKALRGLMRLVRPALGADYRRSNRAVRDAAEQLSSIRDAQALAATFANLRAAADHEDDEGLDSVGRARDQAAAEATLAISADDPRVRDARSLLKGVRKRAARWKIPKGFDGIEGGLTKTYRRGRQDLKAARQDPTDERIHEWRKRVKYLWHQTRLLEPTAPSLLAPFVDRLDDLADALGDDHDLAVLVRDLEAGEDGAGHGTAAAVELARARQDDLRHRAFSLGARLYAERPTDFASRMRSYWEIDHHIGKERSVGGIAELAGLEDDRENESISTVERERTFLVAERPSVTDGGERIRQGYLAIDGRVSARVRERQGSGLTLTIKAGSGSTRTELEWEIDRTRFEALWPLAEERGIDKTRYRLPLGADTALLDVFEGNLEGLCLVEVEFDSADAMHDFKPPEWFGVEVTDDGRYSNAHLAAHGLTVDQP